MSANFSAFVLISRDKKAVIEDLRDQSRAKDVELEREAKKKERIDREIKVTIKASNRSVTHTVTVH